MVLPAFCKTAGGAFKKTAGAAWTCAGTDANFFIQGNDGSQWVLLYINVGADGTVTERWRADVQNGASNPYGTLSVGNTYLYAQDPSNYSKWYVLSKSDGSVVNSRDFSGVEVGSQKQVNPAVNSVNRVATDLLSIGDYCYFVSWWWVDKTQTNNDDSVQRGVHIVNNDDLTDYGSAPTLETYSNLYNRTSPANRIINSNAGGSLWDQGRGGSLYKGLGSNYWIAAVSHTDVQSGSPVTIKNRTTLFSVNDPYGTPSVSYGTGYQVIDPGVTGGRRVSWAPVASGDGTLLLTDGSGFLLKYVTGSPASITQGTFTPIYGQQIASDYGTGSLSGWVTAQRRFTSNHYDLSIDDGGVDQELLISRSNSPGTGYDEPITASDSSNRAYVLSRTNGLRYNDPSDLTDTTSVDLSGLTDITQIKNNFGYLALNAAGGGIHSASAGAW